MSDELFQEIGIRLKEIRNRRNITLREAAKSAGVDFSYLSQIEKGKSTSLGTLKAITDSYDMTLIDLFKDNDVLSNEWVEVLDELQNRGYSPKKIIRIIDLFEDMKDVLK